MTALHDRLADFGIEDCTCPYEFKSLGILYGISMGKDWVRLADDPNCPEHGERSDA